MAANWVTIGKREYLGEKTEDGRERRLAATKSNSEFFQKLGLN